MDWFRKEKSPPGPDFSHIDSREKAERLVETGELVALLMLPEEFGGDGRPENVVFVPQFVADLRESAHENIIRPLVAEGKVTQYSVEPEYAGKCFIPIALKLKAYNPAEFTYEIRIWGEALGRP